MWRPLARHGARTRRVSRDESTARRPRTWSAARAAIGRSVGGALETSVGSRDLLGMPGSSRGVHAAGCVGASVAGVFVRDAGAFWKFDRVGVLNDTSADAERRQVSRARVRRRPWPLHVHDCRGGVSSRTLRGLGLCRKARRQRRGHVDVDSGGAVGAFGAAACWGGPFGGVTGVPPRGQRLSSCQAERYGRKIRLSRWGASRTKWGMVKV